MAGAVTKALKPSQADNLEQTSIPAMSTTSNPPDSLSTKVERESERVRERDRIQHFLCA